MADGYFNYSGDFQGDKVAEAEKEIAGQHSAPYFDTTTHRQDDGNELEIEFSLPLDYDQNDWEKTVDAFIAISQDLEEYHKALHTASEKHLKSI
ncbi:hypothetical protein [Haloferax volcanii]|uniref:Uncharacterized protein n=2 Tax=Haloferax volcanii TaxID=2246 RepID=D4GWD3_HALVD|nr:hypothetical protein [Haloferax volcanii]ADE03750.1 uncharacterized protein HVO_2285 [Haloferax volcanii DS2]MBS8120611.1 hypothetical protein [Haloferax volcanii]MBS8125648.1 hypothetical protein [Haloferax volcanii]MBS8129657.1 hypothetical protein [Haloferax volcanii]MBS8133522.1 hypothetical protein [Haloferax volcanii]